MATNQIQKVASGNFEGIPNDILYMIVERFLTRQDIGKLCTTSRFFQERFCRPPGGVDRGRFDRLWKTLYERHFSSRPPKDRKGNLITSYREAYDAALRGYQNRLRLKRNLQPIDELKIATFLGYESIVNDILTKNPQLLTETNINNLFLEAVDGGNDDMIDLFMAKNPTNYAQAVDEATRYKRFDLILRLLPFAGKLTPSRKDYISSEAARHGRLDVIKEVITDTDPPFVFDAILSGGAVGDHPDIIEYAYARGARNTDYSFLNAAGWGSWNAVNKILDLDPHIDCIAPLTAAVQNEDIDLETVKRLVDCSEIPPGSVLVENSDENSNAILLAIEHDHDDAADYMLEKAQLKSPEILLDTHGSRYSDAYGKADLNKVKTYLKSYKARKSLPRSTLNALPKSQAKAPLVALPKSTPTKAPLVAPLNILPKSPTKTPLRDPSLCKAKTKAGAYCSRKAKPGSDFCWQHQ